MMALPDTVLTRIGRRVAAIVGEVAVFLLLADALGLDLWRERPALRLAVAVAAGFVTAVAAELGRQLTRGQPVPG